MHQTNASEKVSKERPTPCALFSESPPPPRPVIHDADGPHTPAGAQTAPPPPGAGVPRDLARWRAEHYRDVRYLLDLMLRQGAERLEGRLKVSVTLDAAAGDLVLDWRSTKRDEDVRARVSGIRANGRAVADARFVDEHVVIPRRVLEGRRERSRAELRVAHQRRGQRRHALPRPRGQVRVRLHALRPLGREHRVPMLRPARPQGALHAPRDRAAGVAGHLEHGRRRPLRVRRDERRAPAVAARRDALALVPRDRAAQHLPVRLRRRAVRGAGGAAQSLDAQIPARPEDGPNVSRPRAGHSHAGHRHAAHAPLRPQVEEGARREGTRRGRPHQPRGRGVLRGVLRHTSSPSRSTTSSSSPSSPTAGWSTRARPSCARRACSSPPTRPRPTSPRAPRSSSTRPRTSGSATSSPCAGSTTSG